MLHVTDHEIDAALANVPPGLAKYRWIQERAWSCDTRHDRAFQRRFKGFYRVRRDDAWCVPYFELLEEAKAGGVDFARALRVLRERTGRLEASFASKLVATIDPSLPVVDRFVLENMGLRLPYPYAKDREARIVRLYEELRGRYDALLRSPTGRLIVSRYDGAFPDAPVSELKKIDLVLWQHRGVS